MEDIVTKAENVIKNIITNFVIDINKNVFLGRIKIVLLFFLYTL